MRAYLQGLGFVQQIQRDLSREIDADELPVVKFKTDTRLRLLAKILPDVQSVQLTGSDGGPMQTTIIVGFQ